MAKRNAKKGDGELEKELKQQLSLDIEILESKIFLEQQKEMEALKEYESVIKEIKDEEQKIEITKMEEGGRINNENKFMSEKISVFKDQVTALEKTIREYDEEIKSLERTIVERTETNKKMLEEKDNEINEQRKLFEDMSQRFQHILQRTANKLQERVNMGA